MLNKSIIQLINRILQNNTGALSKLQQYALHTWTIKTDIITIRASIDTTGEFIPTNNVDTDCIIQIPLSLASSLITKDKILIFKQLKITGNQDLAKMLLECLSELHFDGIYKTQNQVINLILYKLSIIIKQLHNYITLVGTNANVSIHDYLIYENCTSTYMKCNLCILSIPYFLQDRIHFAFNF